MPVVNRDITVLEGQPAVIQISDEDVESFTYSVTSRDGTAQLVGPDGTSDYTFKPQAGGGDGPFSLEIPTEDDEIYEGPTAETFFLDYTADITTLEGENPPTPVTTPFSGVVTVHIDDSADIPVLEIGPLEIKEDEKVGTLLITADHAASFDYTIHVVVGGDGDVAPTTYDVVMKAMNQAVSLQIPLVDDFKREASPTDLAENFEELSVTATSDFDSVISQIKIINDDGPVITVKPESGSSILAYEGYEAGRATVSLSPVPYAIELIFTPTDPDALKEITLKRVVINANSPGGTYDIFDAIEDNSPRDLFQELTEKITFTVTARPLSGDEKIYFDDSGSRSTDIDAHVRDAIERYLEHKGDGATMTKTLGQVQSVKNLIVSSALKYSGDADYVAFGKAISSAGKILTIGLNVEGIVSNFLEEAAAAERSRNPEQFRKAAAIHATVDFFDLAVKTAFNLGAAGFVAGLIEGLAITTFATPLLIAVGAGLATKFAYDMISPYVKKAALDVIIDAFGAPHLTLIDTTDGGHTFNGDLNDNLFLVSDASASISEANDGGFDTVLASTDFKLATNIEALILTDEAKVATGNEFDNFITGNSANNLLYGAGGKDFVSGGDGNDFLAGQSDADVLSGGAGADVFSGTIAELNGDRITDYAFGEKILVAGGPTSLSSYRIEHTATDTLIEIDADGDGIFESTITLSGVINGKLTIAEESDPTVTNDDSGAVYASIVIQQFGGVIDGTDASETLEGTPGDDQIYGMGGDDTIHGGDGVDWLVGGDGNDTIDGGAGEGEDTVVYSDKGEDGGGAVTVNLSNVQVGSQAAHSATDTFGDTDTLLNIDEVFGTMRADTIIGSTDGNYNGFWGLGGNDTLVGGSHDTWIYYHRDQDFGGTAGVTVNLSDVQRGSQAANSATDGFGDTDTLQNIDRVRATVHDDVVYGNDANNMFQMLDGDDFVDGGDGADMIDYSKDNRSGAALHGAFVNLSGQAQASFLGTVAAHSAIGIFDDTDTLVSIEEVQGTAFDDVIIAELNPDKYQGIWGFAGNDAITGGGKNSWVYYFDDASFGGGAGVVVNLSDIEQGGQAAHTATDGFGDTDTLINVGSAMGTVSDDVFYGDGKDNQFELNRGNDFVDGDGGNDMVNYSTDNDGSATHGVFVNFTDQTRTSQLGTVGPHSAIGLYGDIDTLVDVEEATGSEFADVFIAEDSPHKYQGFWGLAGNDTIVGGGANSWTYYNEDASFGGSAGVVVNLSDTVQGGQAAHSATDGFGDTDTLAAVDNVKATASNDRIYGNTGSNMFELGAGDDFADGGDGFDTIDYSRDDDGTASHGALVNLSGQSFTTDFGSIGPRSAIGLFGDSDTLLNIENATGSELGDYIIGNGQANVLEGLGGDDTLIGGGGDDTFYGGRGNDTMDGGSGLDTVDYSRDIRDPSDSSKAGVTVNLLGNAGVPELGLDADRAHDLWGDLDVVTNIRNVVGTQYNDTIYGGTHANSLKGGDGNDELLGGGDNDTLDGGNGTDTARYLGNRADYLVTENADGSLTVSDLRAGTPDGVDTLTGIELLRFADRSVPAAANTAPIILGAGTASINENIAFVAKITSTDPDLGDSLVYSIIGGDDQAKFAIDPTTGDLSFIAAPDFEGPTDADGNNVYQVVVQVSDGLGGLDTQDIAVTVSGVNEAPIIGKFAVKAVQEGTTAILDLPATDPEHDTLTYSVSGVDAQFITVDESGHLSFATPPDFDNPLDADHDNVYDITVTVSDGSLTDSRDITIAVNAAPGGAPVFTSGTTAEFTENGNGTVYTAAAADPDAGDVVTYSIDGVDKALFNVNADTGEVTFKTAPDHENPLDQGHDNVYDITVTATDASHQTSQNVAITVTDIDDAPPVIDLPDNGAIDTAENVASLLTITAADPDSPAADVTYSISGGFDGSFFQIDANSGELSWKQAPDFEHPLDPPFPGSPTAVDQLYDVQVRATDVAGNFTDRLLTFRVTNVNDNAPTVTSAGIASVAENSTGTAYQILATDADNLGGLTYSLTGTDAERFTINAAGAVSFISAPNFEAPTDSGGNNVYDIVVTASDGTLSTSQAVSITVTDIAEGTTTITGTPGNNTLNGTTGDDVISGLAGNDTLNGLAGNDHLLGGTGADILDGGTGADIMQGGAGGDTYVVDNVGDVVDEGAAGSRGNDLVQSSISFSLVASAAVLGEVENLTLTGGLGINGTGNALANIITGNAGDNILEGQAGNDTLVGNGGDDQLFGGAGNDTMRGGAGNDVYYVDSAADRVDELGGSGVDQVNSSVGYSLSSGRVRGDVENLVLAGTASIDATGNALNNFLGGNAGDNTLDGRAGADTMSGGAGNDTYIVDNVNDVVIESVDGLGGIDTVRASLTYALSNSATLRGVENLVLTGNGNIDGTGNDLDNAIIGNNGNNVLSGGGGNDILDGSRGTDTLLGGAGNDTLNGGAGADTLDGGTGADLMSGGDGNDLYIVDNAGDSIREAAGEGTDTVRTALATFTLSDNVENLVFTGTGGFTATGNASNNAITGGIGADNLSGGGGNDVLSGGTGNDFLAGGAGADQFLFNTSLSAAGVDTITDFVTRAANAGVHDRIVLDNGAGMFSTLANGTLANAAFAVANGGLAQDASDRIIYDPTNGWLTYDSNGNAAGGNPIHFATLDPHLDLRAADFLVI